jgi:hypothetical protein
VRETYEDLQHCILKNVFVELRRSLPIWTTAVYASANTARGASDLRVYRLPDRDFSRRGDKVPDCPRRLLLD